MNDGDVVVHLDQVVILFDCRNSVVTLTGRTTEPQPCGLSFREFEAALRQLRDAKRRETR